VLFVDGHCRIPSRTLLRDMVELFERTGADCLARPQPLVGTGEGLRARAIAAARTSPFGHSRRSTIYDHEEHEVSPASAGAMYRREVFERVGTFDPAFDACEDVEFNCRVEQAGMRCWTSPRLAVHYEPRRTYGGLWRQMVRYGLGRARLAKRHAGARSWETWIPVLFTLGLLPLAASPWIPAPWRWMVVAPYAAYAVLAGVAAWRAARGLPRAAVPLVALAFPVLHTGLGFGYLKGWLGTTPAAPKAP
jgi:succinoglycan biosynthesis protein ExoA